jgi:2-polyprenyl-3-methyl-5-hydroxy-6-metoxy-1,4-benzoquinol methylase
VWAQPAAPHRPNKGVPPFHEYEYRDAEPSYDAKYLTQPVLALCKTIGVKRILDLGCGNGVFSAQLAAAGFDVVGCDPSASGITIARRSNPGVTFKKVGVDEEPARLDEPPFDAVVALEVVEHLYAPRNLPRFARSVLKPGGYLLVSTPYHGFLKNLSLAVTNKWDAHLSPLWDGGHIKFWSRRTLRRLCEGEAFVYDRFVGAGRVPWLWKSMILVFRS